MTRKKPTKETAIYVDGLFCTISYHEERRKVVDQFGAFLTKKGRQVYYDELKPHPDGARWTDTLGYVRMYVTE